MKESSSCLLCSCWWCMIAYPVSVRNLLNRLWRGFTVISVSNLLNRLCNRLTAMSSSCTLFTTLSFNVLYSKRLGHISRTGDIFCHVATNTLWSCLYAYILHGTNLATFYIIQSYAISLANVQFMCLGLWVVIWSWT